MTTSFETLAVKYMTDLIRDFGFADFQAAAIPGNAGEESGGFAKLQEISPIGGGAGGLGPWQWTGPRRHEYEAWLARKNAKPGDYEADYGYLYRDLIGPGGNATAPAGVVAAVKAAATLEAATEAFMNTFEKPNPQYAHLDVRISYAKRALDAFRAAGGMALVTVQAPAPQSAPVTIFPAPSAASARAFDPVGDFLRYIASNPAAGQQALRMAIGLFNALNPAAQIPLDQPKAPSAPPAPASVPALQQPGTATSLLATIGTFAGMVTGHVGTPFGLGESPTSAGSLATLASIGSTLFAAAGGWASLGKVAVKIIPALVAVLPK